MSYEQEELYDISKHTSFKSPRKSQSSNQLIYQIQQVTYEHQKKPSFLLFRQYARIETGNPSSVKETKLERKQESRKFDFDQIQLIASKTQVTKESLRDLMRKPNSFQQFTQRSRNESTPLNAPKNSRMRSALKLSEEKSPREFMIDQSLTNNNLEFVRIKELYKWKSEELEQIKKTYDNEQIQIKERISKLNDGEVQLRILAQQLQEKVKQVTLRENKILEERELFDNIVQSKNKEFEELKQQLNEKEIEINARQQELEQKQKQHDLSVKDYILQQQILQDNIQKLQIKEIYIREKEAIYLNQIDTLNQNIQLMIQQENNLKILEQNLSKQIQQLVEFENKLSAQVLSQKIQEEVCNLREQGMQLTEELFSKKIEREVKNQFDKLSYIRQRENLMKQQSELVQKTLKTQTQESPLQTNHRTRTQFNSNDFNYD